MELICVDKENCRRDGICIAACPIGCIEADADGFPVPANEENCINCGHCVAICPHGALSHSRLDTAAFTPVPRERAGFHELEGLMKARRSVREYKDAPLSRETLAGLLNVARIAPTAKNTQQLSYIMVEDPAKSRALAAMVVDWMRPNPDLARYVRMWDNGRDCILRGAPHALIALGDARNDWGDIDASIALTYVELAAAAQGLGACWGGLLHRAVLHSPQIAAFVGVPEGRKVCGAMMLGAPKLRYALVPPRNEVAVSWV